MRFSYVHVCKLDDHSRTKLSFVDDEPGSDYINANYIPVRNAQFQHY